MLNPKYLLLWGALCLCIASHHATAQQLEWAAHYYCYKQARVNDLAVDYQGNLTFVGNFSHVVDFDITPSPRNLQAFNSMDGFIVQYDSMQYYLWGGEVESAANDNIENVVVNPYGYLFFSGPILDTVDVDPGIQTRYLNADHDDKAFIGMMDQIGQLYWGVPLKATGSAMISEIVLDPYGGVFAIGTFGGTADFDPGSGTYSLTAATKDVFVWKLNYQGELVWVKQFEGTGMDQATSIHITSDLGLLVSGGFQDTFDLDPGPAVQSVISNGTWDNFICKLDATGNFLWGKTIGNVQPDFNYGAQADATDTIYWFGGYDAALDVDPGPNIHQVGAAGQRGLYLLKLDPAGDFVQANTWSLEPPLQGENTWFLSPTSILFGGRFTHTVDFDPGVATYPLTSMGSMDAFLMQLDKNGGLEWVGQFGGTQAVVQPRTVFKDDFGNIIMGGEFSKRVDFDPSPDTTFFDGGTGKSGFIVQLQGVDDITAVSEVREMNFSLWPNPNQGTFTISLPEMAAVADVEVVNMLGQAVYRRRFEQQNKLSVELGGVAAGVYAVRVSTESGVGVRRVKVD